MALDNPDRPVSSDRLRAALSLADTDISEHTLHTYVSHARRALGPDRLPPAGDRGYQLADIDCDWTTFQALTARARTAPPDRARVVLGEALRLDRGPAMPDAPRWAQNENLELPRLSCHS